MVAKYTRHRKPYVGRYPNTSLLAGQWAEQGACTPDEAGEKWDPGLHYNRNRIKEAQQVCAPCPVAAQCLAYAKANGIAEGVWGGKSFFSRSPGRPSTTSEQEAA